MLKSVVLLAAAAVLASAALATAQPPQSAPPAGAAPAPGKNDYADGKTWLCRPGRSGPK
jgi:hypothetical protein